MNGGTHIKNVHIQFTLITIDYNFTNGHISQKQLFQLKYLIIGQMLKLCWFWYNTPPFCAFHV